MKQFARITHQINKFPYRLKLMPFSHISRLPQLKILMTGALASANFLNLGSLATAQSLAPPTVQPPIAPVQPSTSSADYCFTTPAQVTEKNRLRSAALNPDPAAKLRYRQYIYQSGQALQNCRQKSWLKTQAIWIRMYPCDSKPGAVDELLDRMVEKGYNQVYLATFYAGRVLLPQANNPTTWPSVLDTTSVRNTDFLAEVIRKGRERGLKVYAWMYSLNFGSNYGLYPNHESAFNINGRNEKSWFVGREGEQSPDAGGPNSILFVNPYSEQAKKDFSLMLTEVLKRRPDGVLFDYIRYPRGQGAQSVAATVKDLWIYGPDARKGFEAMAQNNKASELIKTFLTNGDVQADEVTAIDASFPDEKEPLWIGRSARPTELKMTPQKRAELYNRELWQLAVGYAGDGVVQFLSNATSLAQRYGVPAGAVFFPEGNNAVGKGYDSRLQRWNRFPRNMEWHPMAYAICGQSKCIEDQVTKMLTAASSSGTTVIPALAGAWGRTFENRPSLETQMDGIHRSSPGLSAISHFSYSWQEPASDSIRSSCRLLR
jgi:Glycosyl hydrolase-like 10